MPGDIVHIGSLKFEAYAEERRIRLIVHSGLGQQELARACHG